jgi:hypothetical protein
MGRIWGGCMWGRIGFDYKGKKGPKQCFRSGVVFLGVFSYKLKILVLSSPSSPGTVSTVQNVGEDRFLQ